MNNAELNDLVAFQNWARERALPALETLTPEEWLRPLGGSFAHLYATVLHILGAQEIRTERLRGGGNPGFPVVPEVPDFPALRQRWRAAGQALEAWLAAQPAGAAQQRIRYTRQGQTVETPVQAAMLQLSHHHAYHLGQVAQMLLPLGHVPADTGYIAYQRQLGDARERPAS